MYDMRKILLWDLGTPREELNEPIGIELLASYILKYTINSSVKLRWSKTDNNYEQLRHEYYDIVGLSLNLGTLSVFKAIHSIIAQQNQNTIIVLGGTLPTFAYKEILKEFPNTICVRGEGEKSIVDLVSLSESTCELIDFKLLHNIPNLAFIHNGQLVETRRHVESFVRIHLPLEKRGGNKRYFEDNISRV
jgi:radical SAM superfamily enzyme YgiQ (UPF0313 family)